MMHTYTNGDEVPTGAEVSAMIKAAGLPVAEVARRLGATVSALHNWRSNRRPIRFACAWLLWRVHSVEVGPGVGLRDVDHCRAMM